MVILNRLLLSGGFTQTLELMVHSVSPVAGNGELIEITRASKLGTSLRITLPKEVGEQLSIGDIISVINNVVSSYTKLYKHVSVLYLS